MSRRLAVLAGICAVGVFAGAAGAGGPTGGGNPPPDGTPPFDPPPAGSALPVACKTQETHPVPCRLWNVSCSLSSKVCKTTGVSGPADATVRKLVLHLPRSVVSMSLTCTQKTERITCRIIGETTRPATGIRTVVLRLPNHFASGRIRCGTNRRSGFACRMAT